MQAHRLKVLAAAVCSAAFLFLMLYPLFFLFHAPVLGIETAWNDEERLWQVSETGPGSVFEKNDLLLEIGDVRAGFLHLLKDNIHITDRWEVFAWFEAKEAVFEELTGPQVRVVIRRDGRLVQVNAPVREAGFSFLKKIESLHLLVGAAFFIIGLAVFWKKGFVEVSLVFSLMCMALALTFITNAASMMSEIVYAPSCFAFVNILNIPNPVAIAAFMMHFSLLMPEKRRFLARLRRLPWVFYASCAFIELTLSIKVMNIVFPILFILSLLAMVQGYVQYKDPISRQQMRWMISGFGFGLLPFVLLGCIPLLVTGERVVSDTVPGLFLIIIPLFMAFAIQKYHLMDIDTLFDNTIIYSATFGVLTILDMAVISLFTGLLPETYRLSEPVVAILTVWLAIILYVPVRNRFRGWVKRLLKREVYDPNEVSIRLSGRLMSAADVEDVFERTLNVIDETLHPQGAYPCFFAGTSLSGKGSAACPNLPPGWENEARKITGATHLYEIFGPEVLPVEYSAGVIVPITGQSGVTGCLVFRNKYSGRMYGRNDLALLDMASRQASLAIESIVSREAMHRKEREANEIREHISREMHDGIGSSFSNAIMMLDLLSKEVSGVAGSGRRIRNLKDLLDDGLADIRSLIRTMEEEGCSLEDFADLVRGKADRLLAGKDISLVMKQDLEANGLPVSPLVLHHVLKIVQEGVTNVLKHSGATSIQIQVRERGGVLAVSITDDGRGFDVSLLDSGGYGLRNMKKRCDEMAAELRFSSSPGQGANISVVIPVLPATVSSREAG